MKELVRVVTVHADPAPLALTSENVMVDGGFTKRVEICK
jgi:hypothetical protein